MARFFFDIHDGIEASDGEGVELPDMTAARANAMRVATAYANDPRMIGQDGGAIVVQARDDQGAAFTIRLAFTVETR